MNKSLIVIALFLFSAFVLAHGGEDPMKELQKNRNRLATMQITFDKLVSTAKRVESLESQANYLQRNVLILRNLMAKDYPHVSENMSKYKLDYIEELDDSLKVFRQTIKQMKATITE